MAGIKNAKIFSSKIGTNHFRCIIRLHFHILPIRHTIWQTWYAGGRIMKATGIVRRIDDLGRVVIPKEIRRTLRLREGTPLEIFTDREGEIILKKYSPMVELAAFAVQYAEAMAQSTGLMVCIADRDQIIAVSGGPKKEYYQKTISRALELAVSERQNICAARGEKAFIPITSDEMEESSAEVIVPILSEGDAIGAVILLSREAKQALGGAEMKLAATAAGFLGRQMEG
jgi:AbrB family transcriptional regulator (stage V sporulation protein T)